MLEGNAIVVPVRKQVARCLASLPVNAGSRDRERATGQSSGQDPYQLLVSPCHTFTGCDTFRTRAILYRVIVAISVIVKDTLVCLTDRQVLIAERGRATLATTRQVCVAKPYKRWILCARHAPLTPGYVTPGYDRTDLDDRLTRAGFLDRDPVE